MYEKKWTINSTELDFFVSVKRVQRTYDIENETTVRLEDNNSGA